MAEPKPIASLSSSLLARKGHAKPAMRPQGFASFGYAQSAGYDDLGWNDMGTEPVATIHAVSADVVPIVATAILAPEPTPEPPVVVRQQEDLAREMTPDPVVDAPTQAAKFMRAAPGSKGKAAFTLRLDPDRHLRLRLACAVAHRSAQSFVVEALDAALSTLPAMHDLARAAGIDRSEK